MQELNDTRLRGIFIGNRIKPFYPRFKLKADERVAIPNIQRINTDLEKDDIGDEDNENKNDDNDNNEKKKKNKEKQLTIPRG